MKKKKIRNRKGSFMVEPKDYRCSLSKLGLERKNDYLVAVTMRDKDAREIKSAMFYPDASCVLLVIGNYKKAPYTYKFLGDQRSQSYQSEEYVSGKVQVYPGSLWWNTLYHLQEVMCNLIHR